MTQPGQQPQIVHVIHSGAFYGAERMLLDHCLATPGRHLVVFIDAPQVLLNRFTEAGIDCACIHAPAELRVLLRPGQIINAHNFRAQIFAWLCARRLGLPLIMTQHGFTPRSLKQKAYTWLSLRMARSTAVRQVVCVSEALGRSHRDAGVPAARISVIPNGLPNSPVAQHPECEAAQEAAPPLVGFVGRLSAEKGPDLFLDALIPLCWSHHDVQAVLLGEGPELGTLRARAEAAGLEDRIRFLGYQTAIHEWLQRLTMLVVSSRTEGTPMILLEAMQAGVPVVAFKVGGIPDMLVDGEDGLLVEPEDLAGLRERMESLIRQPQRAQELGARAQRTQRQRFHLPILAERWAEVYRAAGGSTGR